MSGGRTIRTEPREDNSNTLIERRENDLNSQVIVDTYHYGFVVRLCIISRRL